MNSIKRMFSPTQTGRTRHSSETPDIQKMNLGGGTAPPLPPRSMSLHTDPALMDLNAPVAFHAAIPGRPRSKVIQHLDDGEIHDDDDDDHHGDAHLSRVPDHDHDGDHDLDHDQHDDRESLSSESLKLDSESGSGPIGDTESDPKKQGSFDMPARRARRLNSAEKLLLHRKGRRLDQMKDFQTQHSDNDWGSMTGTLKNKQDLDRFMKSIKTDTKTGPRVSGDNEILKQSLVLVEDNPIRLADATLLAMSLDPTEYQPSVSPEQLLSNSVNRLDRRDHAALAHSPTPPTPPSRGARGLSLSLASDNEKAVRRALSTRHRLGDAVLQRLMQKHHPDFMETFVTFNNCYTLKTPSENRAAIRTVIARASRRFNIRPEDIGLGRSPSDPPMPNTPTTPPSLPLSMPQNMPSTPTHISISASPPSSPFPSTPTTPTTPTTPHTPLTRKLSVFSNASLNVSMMMQNDIDENPLGLDWEALSKHLPTNQ